MQKALRTIAVRLLRAAVPALAALGFGLAFAPAAMAQPASFTTCASGCHTITGGRVNAANAPAVITAANVCPPSPFTGPGHCMGASGSFPTIASDIHDYYVNTLGIDFTQSRAVNFGSATNTITIQNLVNDAPNAIITTTKLGTVTAARGLVTAGNAGSFNVNYQHTANSCTGDTFSIQGTGAADTADRTVNITVNAPSFAANTASPAAIPYSTSATTISIAGSIAVGGGGTPTGTIGISGQSGVGTLVGFGATSVRYTATGNTYSPTITATYSATGPTGCGVSDTGPLTITVNQPANPTANDVTPAAIPSTNGAVSNISVAGQYSGFTAASPLDIVTQPSQGTVTVLNATTFQYTANGVAGTTTFTYRVLGPTGSTAVSPTRTITLNPTDAPLAGDTTATTAFNTFVDVNLAASITGPSTSVAVSGVPTNGTATVWGASTIRFTPTAGFFGTGTFQYTATNSGVGTSPTPGTVTVTVNPPVPVAAGTTANVPYNTATPIDVSALITPLAPGTTVSTQNATNGTVGVAGTVITFTPTAGYIGAASFQYRATNVTGSSAFVTVNLTVQPPAAPTAGSIDVVVSSTQPTPIDVSSLLTSVVSTLTITQFPTSGSAVPTSASMITYTPGPVRVASDTFFYVATGPGGSSAPARIRVFYTDAPVTPDRQVAVTFNTLTIIELASRITGAFTGSISFPTMPTHGQLLVRGSEISYLPDANYTGPDSFTYSVTGSGGASTPGTVRITVNPPLAQTTNAMVNTAFNTPAQIDLSRFVAGTVTTFVVTVQPEHGTVTISGNIATYKPAAGYFGPDTFTFIARNGAGDSPPAVVNITVGSLKPVVSAGSLVVPLNSSATLDTTPLLAGSGLTGVTVSSKPAHGTVEVNGTSFTYTPNHNYFGTDTFQYVAFGNLGSSLPATITVTIIGRPDPRDDPDVRGLVDAQAQVPSRFARAQLGNFNRRLETLHRGPDSAFPEKPVKPAEPASAPSTSSAPAAAASPNATSAPNTGALPGPNPEGTALPPAAGPLTGLSPLVSSLISLANSQTVALNGATTFNNGLSVWIAGLAQFGELDGENGRSGSRFSTDGMSVGIDKRLNDATVLGFGAGYARDRAGIGTNGTNNKSRGSSFAAYGSLQPSPTTYVDMLLGLGKIDMDSQRYVSELSQFATARRKVDQVFGSISAGYEWRQDGVLVSPYGRLEFAQDKFKSATESGAGQYNLTFNGETSTNSAGAIGLRAESQHEMDSGRAIPRLRVEYRRAFQDDVTTTINYADLFGGTEYSVSSKGTSRNSLLLGIGSDFLLSGGLKLGFDYTVERNTGSKNVQSVRLIAVQDLDFKNLPPFRFSTTSLARPVSVDFGATYDDNVSRGRLDSEKRSDSLFSLGVGQEYVFPIGTNFRLVATPLVTGEKFRRWAGLGRVSGGATGEVQYRTSGAFDATTFGLKGSAIYDQYESSLRTGGRYFLGVNARRSITDKIDLFAEAGANRREGKSEVFQLKDWVAKANMDYSLGRNGLVYVSGEYRKGDTFASGLPSLTNAAIADVFVIDDAFENQLVAYRLDARTVLGTLGYNRPLGPRDSLDFSYRRVQTDPSHKPSFDAGGPLKYIDNQYSIVYLLRF